MPWQLPSTEAELLALAKGYPYDHPGGSYLYRDGAVRPLTAADAAVFAGRTPVIAHGSNRSPAQLKRKFDHLAGGELEIPVSRGRLADHDVVYSAHVTRYGSIAANLQHAPGVRVEVYVTWLDPRQLARMHDTELGSETYAYGSLTEIVLDLDHGPAPRIAEAFVYLSKRGCLADADDGGAPRAIGLAAVPAEGRTHRAMSQDEVLQHVLASYGDGCPLDSHILDTIRDPERRRAVVEAMGLRAVAPAAPHFTEILFQK